jgi:hypothetical protein
MQDGSPAPFTEFFYFQFLRLLLLVHRRRVVAPLADRAHQSNNIGHKLTSSLPAAIIYDYS